ncbi:zinc ribbon protein [Halanaerobium saccharolyticum]|uniref:Zinc ribbon protein n=1 Tax=Halanaerobium saccharolyticum TaxID=43595 RepID=A0A4R6LUI0_9FIRM|nr:zinc ribbon domain-containing protein [Halanaerobium saccharolyticum]TDO92294.1 zinc ribbon protein [Halanaerobium saccharolyticum]
MIVIYCSQCGSEVNENDKFCSGCGAELNKDSAEEVTEPDKKIDKPDANTEDDEDLDFEDMGKDSDPNLLNSSNKSGGCLKSFMSFAAVIVILAGLGLVFGEDVENSPTDQPKQSNTKIEQTQKSEGSNKESTLHKIFGDNEEKKEIEVFIDPNIYAQNNKLIIEGNTNLIDGALITYNVTVENLDDITWEMTEDEEMKKRLDLKIASMTSGDFKVKDGKLKKEIDISEFVDGNLLVDIGFYPFEQPDNVIDKYGKNNRLITGENVIERKSLQNKNQKNKIIEKSYRVTFN